MLTSEPPPPRIVDTRRANALFDNATMSDAAKVAMVGGGIGINPGAALGGLAGLRTIEILAERNGGLWVGGTATLTTAALLFEPNAVNRMVHENGAMLRLDLPLAEIGTVTVRSGFLTNIIHVGVYGTTFSLRCFGAKGFAAAIDSARRATRAGG